MIHRQLVDPGSAPVDTTAIEFRPWALRVAKAGIFTRWTAQHAEAMFQPRQFRLHLTVHHLEEALTCEDEKAAGGNDARSLALAEDRRPRRRDSCERTLAPGLGVDRSLHRRARPALRPASDSRPGPDASRAASRWGTVE